MNNHVTKQQIEENQYELRIKNELTGISFTSQLIYVNEYLDKQDKEEGDQATIFNMKPGAAIAEYIEKKFAKAIKESEEKK